MVGLRPPASGTININLVKAGSSSFKDQGGRVHRFTHGETDPKIQFTYDGTSCAVLSNSDARLQGGQTADVYIRYSPYGTWRLEVVGHESLDLSTVTAVRFEFDLARSPGGFGGSPIFFDDGAGCAGELGTIACTADGPLATSPSPPDGTPPASDCVEATAAAGDCTACGEERYTRTAEPRNGGAACVGSSTLCADGDGAASCPPPCCGAWCANSANMGGGGSWCCGINACAPHTNGCGCGGCDGSC